MTFKLNEILERDSHFVTNFELCQMRLIDNSDYPWIILVPMKENIVEITDLKNSDFDLLNKEVRKIAGFLKNEFKADKLNIATIGNVVPQLHMHVIARFKDDKLFPKTVWGHEFSRYNSDRLKLEIKKFQKILAG